jgi:hypothetical protein
VTTWFDSSPAHRNATPVSAAPVYRGAAVNGHPAVEFMPYATATRMLVPGWGTALTGSNQYTMFQVVQQRSYYGDYPVVACAPTNGDWQWITEFDTSAGVYWGHGNGCYNMYDAKVPINSTHLLSYHLKPGDPHFFLDGTEVTAIGWRGPSGPIQPTVPNIGPDVLIGAYTAGQYAVNGYICAVLWYDHALTDLERQQVETYLKTTYGL